MGSVHYFSPEHARGGFTDAKSDLYSLGVVLYEMVTGRLPFNADTAVSVALKHMQESPKEPMEINPSVPKSVNDIIMKAMQKDISLRYQTATEMLRDLSRAIKNPNGDFVVMERQVTDSPTQRLSTIYDKSELEDKKMDKKKEKSFFAKHKALCLTIGGIILFIITIVATYFIMNAFEKKDVQVPDLVNMEKSQAEAKAKELKLQLVVGEEAYNKDVLAGCVISQNPAYMPDFKIKEGSEITVVISKGKNTVIMPKVVGMSKDDAVTQLEDLDLIVNVVEEYDKKVEAGYVIKQDVDAKKEIDAGETVTITVSKGIEKVTVPNLVGKTEAEAKKAITDAGLKLKSTYTDNDESKAEGVVLYQDVEADTEVEKNTSISITINRLLQKKKGIVNVNVKSLLGGKIPNGYKEDGVTPKEVKLKITVNGTTIYEENVDPRLASVSQEFSNKGNVTIKVFIDDVKKGEDRYLDLEYETEITID